MCCPKRRATAMPLPSWAAANLICCSWGGRNAAQVRPGLPGHSVEWVRHGLQLQSRWTIPTAVLKLTRVRSRWWTWAASGQTPPGRRRSATRHAARQHRPAGGASLRLCDGCCDDGSCWRLAVCECVSLSETGCVGDKGTAAKVLPNTPVLGITTFAEDGCTRRSNPANAGCTTS